MIAANELTDGRFVYRVFDSPKSDKDKEIICLSGVNGIYNTYVCEDGNIGSLSELESIPLTEEVLLKCGADSNWLIGLGGDHSIGVSLDADYYDNCFIRNFRQKYRLLHGIKHLHQLQNLYFALTGKELEIKNL